MLTFRKELFYPRKRFNRSKASLSLPNEQVKYGMGKLCISKAEWNAYMHRVSRPLLRGNFLSRYSSLWSIVPSFRQPSVSCMLLRMVMEQPVLFPHRYRRRLWHFISVLVVRRSRLSFLTTPSPPPRVLPRLHWVKYPSVVELPEISSG